MFRYQYEDTFATVCSVAFIITTVVFVVGLFIKDAKDETKRAARRQRAIAALSSCHVVESSIRKNTQASDSFSDVVEFIGIDNDHRLCSVTCLGEDVITCSAVTCK